MSIREASRKFGCNRRSIQRRLEKERTTDGFTASGVSTLYDANGEVRAQWVKETAAKRSPEHWAEHVREAFKGVRPVPRIKGPKSARKDLMAVYPIGDQHVAMYAWGEEVGADYDIKIAEKLLTSAAAHLVEASPACETALVINVGDYFHVDNLKNETSRSGHTLDVDTRYAAMIRAGTKMLRQVIETALTKHKRVKVITASGNHDDIGAMWLSHCLALCYEANPRVEIETKPGKFHYHRHGSVLIGVTHGDTGKPAALQGVMAADQPTAWGATKHRYWITGHVHHRSVTEFPGVSWETFRTLAPGDAYAHGAGYRAGRDMTGIIFHAAHGEVARHRVDVSMLA